MDAVVPVALVQVAPLAEQTELVPLLRLRLRLQLRLRIRLERQ